MASNVTDLNDLTVIIEFLFVGRTLESFVHKIA